MTSYDFGLKTHFDDGVNENWDRGRPSLKDYIRFTSQKVSDKNIRNKRFNTKITYYPKLNKKEYTLK